MRYAAAPLLALCLCLTLPRPAAAQFMTGEELERNCLGETPKEVYSCIGYISGIIDYHLLIQSLGTSPSVDFCLPQDMRIDMAAAAVLEYLRKAPMNQHFIAAPAVALALTAKFPCAKPKPKRNRRR